MKAASLVQSMIDLFDQEKYDDVRKFYDKIKAEGDVFSVETEEDIEWLESEYEGFSEVPCLHQTSQFKVGDQVIFAKTRVYGVEFVDPTHSGLEGRWATIELDEYPEDLEDNEDQDAEEDEDFTDLEDPEDLFAFLGVKIEEPDLPEPIPDDNDEEEESE